MNPQPVVITHQPRSGRLSFMYAAAVKSQRSYGAQPRAFDPATYRWLAGAQELGYPGEGSA